MNVYFVKGQAYQEGNKSCGEFSIIIEVETPSKESIPKTIKEQIGLCDSDLIFIENIVKL